MFIVTSCKYPGDEIEYIAELRNFEHVGRGSSPKKAIKDFKRVAIESFEDDLELIKKAKKSYYGNRKR